VNFFEKSVELEASLEEVYAFHADPLNLEKVSGGRARLAAPPSRPGARVGDLLHVEARVFGMVQHWTVMWESVEPPQGHPASARLVDRALVSPFAFWRHTHLFRATAPGRTEMTDLVEYKLPVEPWSVAAVPVFTLFLDRMFSQRHAKTREILERGHDTRLVPA
jgi:ligand-binding SRPBCC domain-containing protein